ncbi:MAG: ABC-type sugar transport system, permease component [uncultured bacterium]|nr:MAG: ABC-type sugar transport system, permease component [uncultured bacterium]
MSRSVSKSHNYKDNLSSFSFVLPALILFAIFNIYTFFDLFRLSFFQSNGLPGSKEVFVGLKNYINVFRDKIWWDSVGRAFFITFLSLTLQNLLALILALLVDRGIRAEGLYKLIFFLPPVLSGIVVGLIWEWIFNGDFGLLNNWLKLVNLEHLTRAWLADPETALYAVAFIHMWKGFGWGFVILLAGLQSIDVELYEAAEVDGATWWAKFLNITMPLMIPVFILLSILTILGTMNIYDIIVSTTRGGPGYHTEVPITRILHSMVGSQKYGYASAQGIIFGVILLIISLGQLKFSRRYKQE